MDALFQEMVGTLREARQALQAELDLHPMTCPTDMARLQRLQALTVEFAGQADSLVVMMLNHGSDEVVIEEAEDLSSFFQSVGTGIAFRLGAGRGLG